MDLPEVWCAPRHEKSVAFVWTLHARGPLCRFRSLSRQSRPAIRGHTADARRRPDHSSENAPRLRRTRPFRRPHTSQGLLRREFHPASMAEKPQGDSQAGVWSEVACALRADPIRRRHRRRVEGLASGVPRLRRYARRPFDVTYYLNVRRSFLSFATTPALRSATSLIVYSAALPRTIAISDGVSA